MQAIVERFGMWKGEWENTLRMIDVDCRNNSAWNQRAWLLSACIACRLRRNLPGPSGGGKSCQEDSALEDADDTQPRFMTGAITEWLQSELECCRYHCERTPHNESPWNYLNGLHSIVHDTVVALDRGASVDELSVPRLKRSQVLLCSKRAVLVSFRLVKPSADRTWERNARY